MPAKHTPIRTCIGCGGERAKRELVRVVRTTEGDVVADPTGRRNGRGAYIDPSSECLEKGLAGGALSRALEAPVTEELRERLRRDLAAIASQRQQSVAATRATLSKGKN